MPSINSMRLRPSVSFRCPRRLLLVHARASLIVRVLVPISEPPAATMPARTRNSPVPLHASPARSRKTSNMFIPSDLHPRAENLRVFDRTSPSVGAASGGMRATTAAALDFALFVDRRALVLLLGFCKFSNAVPTPSIAEGAVPAVMGLFPLALLCRRLCERVAAGRQLAPHPVDSPPSSPSHDGKTPATPPSHPALPHAASATSAHPAHALLLERPHRGLACLSSLSVDGLLPVPDAEGAADAPAALGALWRAHGSLVDVSLADEGERLLPPAATGWSPPPAPRVMSSPGPIAVGRAVAGWRRF